MLSSPTASGPACRPATSKLTTAPKALEDWRSDIAEATSELVPQILTFHTATMVSCALLVVFAAGVAGLLVPESLGGAGAGAREAAVVQRAHHLQAAQHAEDAVGSGVQVENVAEPGAQRRHREGHVGRHDQHQGDLGALDVEDASQAQGPGPADAGTEHDD